MTFPKQWIPDCILPVKIIFLPKTKMVRMVHMNIFYKMYPHMCDTKSVFWQKLKNQIFWNLKNEFLGPASFMPCWTFTQAIGPQEASKSSFRLLI